MREIILIKKVSAEIFISDRPVPSRAVHVGIEKQIEDIVVAYAIESPEFGQQRASKELRKRGITVVPSTIRHDLETFHSNRVS